jgi:hypothetical protein
MNNEDREAIMSALTRAISRKDAQVEGADGELLARLRLDTTGPRLRFLADISAILRLMDSFVSGQDTAEGFVEKFCVQLESLKRKHRGRFEPTVSAELDELYESVQFFCASPEERREEPLLYGAEELKTIVAASYGRVCGWWKSQICE